MVQAEFKRLLNSASLEAAQTLLRTAIQPNLDFTTARSLYASLKRFRATVPSKSPIKIAVLSNYTASQLTLLVDLFLFGAGIDATFYQPEYGTFRQEIIDPNSDLYAQAPDMAVITTGWRDLTHMPSPGQSRSEVQALIEAEVRAWSHLWTMLHDRSGCQVIQNNFDQRPWRSLDNHDSREPSGLAGYIARLNLALADAAPPFVTIHDLDHVAASYGRWVWGDDRYFHLAKLPCSPECQVGYAHSLASLIVAHRGLSKKCLVLDLDNTLWGGVIGDDGLGGIRLGQGDPEGEAFQEFQRYVKSLRARGVILAVCSKNEHRIAKEAFDQHPEMVLRYEDISCFVANWEDKASNLRQIAKQLNIGMNALVFVDDNPAERLLVRQLAPDVAVPEMPVEPSEYIRALEQHRYFQTVALSAEDYRRADLYRENTAREAAQQGSGNLDDFLTSMKMTAKVGPINSFSLERSVQLINKSNQFNLTTKRYSNAEILEIMRNPSWVTMTTSLIDRFGDNGLISVLMAKIDDDTMDIDTWLMSCRVLKRGVEQMMLNELCGLAKHHHVNKLRGRYIPTPKNELVANHYKAMGFSSVDGGDGGETQWELNLSDRAPIKTYIEINHV
jgi:FkbH-like protein